MFNKIKRKINRLKYYINLFKYVLENKNTIEKVRKFRKLFNLLNSNKNMFYIKDIKLHRDMHCGQSFYIISSEIMTQNCEFGYKIMQECQYGGYFE